MSSSTATIALCVGHSRSQGGGRPEGGAISVGGESEWTFNSRLAHGIAAELLACHGIQALVVDRYSGTSYGSAMRWLAAFLRAQGGIRLAVELHFNAAESPSASGHEWLYWHASAAGRALAQACHREVSRDFPQLPARGLKPIESGRGAEFLRLTHCPAIIAEPFFGSNAQDWKLASTYHAGLARSLTSALAAVHR